MNDSLTKKKLNSNSVKLIGTTVLLCLVLDKYNEES